ncbi:MAG: polysaccharide biosynthesis/export family protein [Acidobacteria bacterium]|nr:polysaccharide biosynthesis/export family protein [Acidobacteriota bacterium]
MQWKTQKMRRYIAWMSAFAVALTLGLCSAASMAQERHQAPTKPTSPRTDSVAANVLVDAEEDYRIGVSDVIEIKVEDAKALDGTFRIGASGIITMNYLKRLTVINKTTEEVEKMIADGLRGRYLKDPQVHVTVVQVNSRAFFIQGAVKHPGVYQIEGRTSLLKLINVAGGLADNSGSTAYILRENKSLTQENEPSSAATSTPQPQAVATTNQSVAPPPESATDPEYALLTVSLSRFRRGQVPPNIALQPGDVVTIPIADVFFVAGEVNQPGEFTLKEGTTLRQALSLARGTTFEAKASQSMIVREDPTTGKRQEIMVDVGAVMSAKKSDVAIMPNDIIIVPNSRLKTIGGALLKTFGTNAARLPIR